MSSPSSRFEFRWRPSVRLGVFYLAVQLLALTTLWAIDLPDWASASATLVCGLHMAWVYPRYISLTAPDALTALRRIDDDWQLWSDAQGWRSIQLLPDSLALPWLIVLRYRWEGPAQSRMAHTLCIPRDAMLESEHRRLRVRLKFSPRRWGAAG
ncbi:protein YgfX [Pseudomonas sp. RL_15y_Pfl2_60]|uniref:protein YgfX n=1 Tax=Pseudomonas sp. RL_15y_Pfl2_60 TaxID=3088709 RepID=UPI0030D6E309